MVEPVGTSLAEPKDKGVYVGHSPGLSVRTRVFHDALVLVGGDLTVVESNQSRQFVLLNKQKFV